MAVINTGIIKKRFRKKIVDQCELKTADDEYRMSTSERSGKYQLKSYNKFYRFSGDIKMLVKLK